MESWLKNVRDSLTDGEGGLEYIFYNNVREKDDFNYRIDFHEFYRQMKYPADCIHFFDEE